MRCFDDYTCSLLQSFFESPVYAYTSLSPVLEQYVHRSLMNLKLPFSTRLRLQTHLFCIAFCQFHAHYNWTPLARQSAERSKQLQNHQMLHRVPAPGIHGRLLHGFEAQFARCIVRVSILLGRPRERRSLTARFEKARERYVLYRTSGFFVLFIA